MTAAVDVRECVDVRAHDDRVLPRVRAGRHAHAALYARALPRVHAVRHAHALHARVLHVPVPARVPVHVLARVACALALDPVRGARVRCVRDECGHARGLDHVRGHGRSHGHDGHRSGLGHAGRSDRRCPLCGTVEIGSRIVVSSPGWE